MVSLIEDFVGQCLTEGHLATLSLTHADVVVLQAAARLVALLSLVLVVNVNARAVGGQHRPHHSCSDKA